MREYPLKKCAQLGCLAGGAVVQVVGAEMTQVSWRWLFARCDLDFPPSVSNHTATYLHVLGCLSCPRTLTGTKMPPTVHVLFLVGS